MYVEHIVYKNVSTIPILKKKNVPNENIFNSVEFTQS